MGATDIFPLANKALGGQLARRLAKARIAGSSFEAIARDLTIDGVTVSGETVRKWCARPDVEALLSSAPSKQAS